MSTAAVSICPPRPLRAHLFHYFAKSAWPVIAVPPLFLGDFFSQLIPQCDNTSVGFTDLIMPQEKANLARIRDNQRRSRARRKEYLQELEARLRQCELQGIEASSEIQMVARRVADENRKLRNLLTQHGVGDDSVEAYLQSSPTSDTLMGGQFGNASSSVQLLEQLLQRRKTCFSNGNAPMASEMDGRAGSQDSSASTVQSVWDAAANDRHRAATLQPGKAASSAQQFMTPVTSTASRASSAASMGQSSSRGAPQHQMQMPLQMPRHPSTTSSQSNRSSNLFEYNPQLAMSNSTSYNNSPQYEARHIQPQSSAPTQSRYVSTSTTAPNVNSCVYATDIITSMAGSDPSAVRADLGCGSGMDCEVDNHLVFNVMDRYSGSIGL